MKTFVLADQTTYTLSFLQNLESVYHMDFSNLCVQPLKIKDLSFYTYAANDGMQNYSYSCLHLDYQRAKTDLAQRLRKRMIAANDMVRQHTSCLMKIWSKVLEDGIPLTDSELKFFYSFREKPKIFIFYPDTQKTCLYVWENGAVKLFSYYDFWNIFQDRIHYCQETGVQLEKFSLDYLNNVLFFKMKHFERRQTLSELINDLNVFNYTSAHGN